MSTKRPGGTSEEEIEAFTSRMIDEVEDFDNIQFEGEWQEFVRGKMIKTTGRELTGLQVDALEKGRSSIARLQSAVGVERTRPFVTRPTQVRYRDLTGEFQKKGTYVSRANLSARIDYLKRFGF